MRSDLPTGTVTFLFTDVEGSTRLLHELGAEEYAEALAEHRRVIREACAAEGGVEVDTQGDAFFFAFPTAPGALAAAAAFTEALAIGPVSVRVGVHTGTPLLTDEGYVGDDVHFAARVGAASHGGQVVLSSATAQLVELTLVDLGEHRLKDIAEAVPIFQLGAGSFPPLKTISNTNLPRPASSFVGREAELGEVLARVEHGARLVTLTGPGGTGKTRLALEAASTLVPDYRAGVFWVGLASLRDPALVGETIAQVLGAKDGLAQHIGDRELCLLLDNLEQVVECAPELAELIRSCANLTLVVTSRELLRVEGEVEFAVPPLATEDAVDLFCARSQLEPTEEIAELCARLDSLPLAVELAAARTRVLSVSQIVERLSSRLDLLKGGRDADPRQQTLRTTIEWSYELLSPDEQQLFAALAVFAGGCVLESAEEVAYADLDTLQSLVEKSLVRFTNDRYWMLETIREYAAERLDESRELSGAGQRHAEHYLALAERVEDERTNAASTGLLRLIGDEHDNMRLALAWFVEQQKADDALRLICALADYWIVRGHEFEARSQTEAVLALRTGQRPELRARSLTIASDLARMQGDVDAARAFCEESLALARELGDLRAVGQALHELGEAALVEEDFDGAVDLFEEAIASARAAGHNGAGSIGNIGYIALLQGDYTRAQSLAEQAIQLFRDRGHESGVAVGIAILADALLLDGRTEESRRRTKECLRLGGELGFKEVLASAFDTSAALVVHEDAPLSARLFGAAEAIREEIRLTQTPSERDLHRQTYVVLRSSLGAAVVDELREDGRGLDIDDAVEYALASLD